MSQEYSDLRHRLLLSGKYLVQREHQWPLLLPDQLVLPNDSLAAFVVGKKILMHYDTVAEDCGAVVGDAPTCADPSWTLFMDAYAFCCQSGDVGIQGEQCQPKSLTFSAALYAATVGLLKT
jgi:hypothetical protein